VTASVKNYRHISILINVSKIVEIIGHNHLFSLIKHRLNPAQHGFCKSNSITANLVTYLNSIMPPVCTQDQIDSGYFDLSSAFDIFRHDILLQKLSNFGLFSSYMVS
jgi:hypothetical protein